MENLIYFYEYRGNETQNIVLEKVDYKGSRTGYALIKVGIRNAFWQEVEETPHLSGQQPGEQIRVGIWSRLLNRFRRKTKDRTQHFPQKTSNRKKQLPKAAGHTAGSQRAEEPHREMVSPQTELLHEAVAGVLDEDVSLAEDCQIVYERNIRSRLFALAGWSQRFPAGEFCHYRDLFWAEQLLPYARHADYQIIGYAPCIPELLIKHARHIRSVCWILSEAVYTGQLQDFVEDYYEEYGLAISIHLCEPVTSLRKARITSAKPISILDFSGEERMPCVQVMAGSVWLDMDAMEEKARRISIQNPDISYFSLRKMWKNLDTAGKSRYNT